LVGLPWAADSCPWVGKLRTVLPLTNRDVIRDSAVQLGLTHQRNLRRRNKWIASGKSALSGPNREPRSPNVKSIGCCQSVRGLWLSFLGLRTVVRAQKKLRTVSTIDCWYQRPCGAVGAVDSSSCAYLRRREGARRLRAGALPPRGARRRKRSGSTACCRAECPPTAAAPRSTWHWRFF
jgi:hypothetical protein